MSISEYRGQNVIAQLEARLVPPNKNYPDCECILVLTNQHLYVLEDNFDGSYETHFEFVLREIDAIDIERVSYNLNLKGNAGNQTGSYIISAVLGLIGGVLVMPDESQNRTMRSKYIVICYHTVQGEKEKIYFNMPSFGTSGFLKAFRKIRHLM